LKDGQYRGPLHCAAWFNSLHRGLAALPAEVYGAVILLGDTPRVSTAVIDRLIAALDSLEGRAVCLPTWRGRRRNPVLFARRFFSKIQVISGDMGARGLIGGYPDLVCEVPMPDDAVLTDVDTPEVLAALKPVGYSAPRPPPR
jgi:molybdenum cofactor cytidylyltransferase